MKKILILITAIVFAYQVSNAQTEKGSQTLGLNFGFSASNSNYYTIIPSTSPLTTSINSFNIGPTYSYFIANNLDIGGSLSYSSSSTTNTTGDIATTNDTYPTNVTSGNFTGTLFIRKYFMYKNKIGFRAEGYAGLSTGTTKDTYSSTYSADNYKTNTNYYSGGAAIDLLFFPSKNLGVSASLANLEYYHFTYTTTYTANNANQAHNNGDNLTFSFINNGLTLSVFYVFGGK
ncbi:MAG: hypothetical protein ACHQII_04045 [Bacteroidia bacterium]